MVSDCKCRRKEPGPVEGEALAWVASILAWEATVVEQEVLPAPALVVPQEQVLETGQEQPPLLV